MSRLRRLLALMLSVTVLAACGGGGGSSAPTTLPATGTTSTTTAGPTTTVLGLSDPKVAGEVACRAFASFDGLLVSVGDPSANAIGEAAGMSREAEVAAHDAPGSGGWAHFAAAFAALARATTTRSWPATRAAARLSVVKAVTAACAQYDH